MFIAGYTPQIDLSKEPVLTTRRTKDTKVSKFLPSQTSYFARLFVVKINSYFSPPGRQERGGAGVENISANPRLCGDISFSFGCGSGEMSRDKTSP
jgi:hypothetical protein